MPVDALVMAASVRSGSISEIAPTNVVLPTPKPPAMTNLTEVMRLVVPDAVCCTSCFLLRAFGRPGSDRPNAFDHLGEHRQFDLDRVGVVDVEQAGSYQVVRENHHHT